MDDTGDNALLTAAKNAMDASCKLPAGYESQWPQLVLATLDVNQGQSASSHNRMIACQAYLMHNIHEWYLGVAVNLYASQ